MILRVELPDLGPQMDSARITRWHAVPGDAVTYGDPLYDIVVEEITTLRRPSSASRVGGLLRRRAPDEHRVQALELHGMVVATDQGTLRETVAPEGTRVEPGTLVAIVSSSPDEGIDEVVPESVFRSVLNLQDNS